MKKGGHHKPDSKFKPFEFGCMGGRPLMYESFEEFEEKVNDYFDQCDKKKITITNGRFDKDGNSLSYNVGTPYTIEGLALHLGMVRKTLLSYQFNVEDERFSNTITRAKEKITQSKIERALVGCYSERFTIFDLANNSDYSDKKEVDQNINGALPVFSVTLPEKDKTQER